METLLKVIWVKRKKHGLKTFFVFSISLLLLYFLICFIYITYIDDTSHTENYKTTNLGSTVPLQTVENAIEESTTIADMIESVSNSVVGISKFKNKSGSIFSENTENELGIGTGIIISENGYILSNSHVTGEKYSSCYITLENGNTYNSNVVWADSDLDLSICKINVSGLSPVTLGDSSVARAGQTVFAIGNPIGYEFRRTVTSGIISAVNRTIKLEEDDNISYMTDLIQTDATINPGNSGGPLISANGNVIGINTVKIASAEGIGFAIPINVVKPVINSFITTGTFEEASIGILAYDSNVIPYLSSSSNFSSGIYVSQIRTSGPASNSDLKVGDIINSIDNISLNTMNDLKTYIYTKKPGDVVVLNVSRGKITKQISLTLGR